MNEQAGQSYGAVAATAGAGWLTLSFILIAIGIVTALAVLFWGTRLGAQRRRARRELESRGELGAPPAHPAEIPASPEPAPEPPAPAPLADEPIAAAAPMEAAPAALASDTNAEPAPPSPAPAPDAAAEGDDLTRLKGVGRKLAARLRELGITRFAQLAALDAAQAQALDAQLGSFQGRMARDRWVEQARFLAAGDQAGYEAVFGKL